MFLYLFIPCVTYIVHVKKKNVKVKNGKIFLPAEIPVNHLESVSMDDMVILR